MKRASQSEARKKILIPESVDKKNYNKNPEKEKDKKSESKKMKILEENDYAGVRTVSAENNVTEKGSFKKK